MPILAASGDRASCHAAGATAPMPEAMGAIARQPAHGSSIMLDILMLALGFACFGVAILYARACGSF